MDLTALRWSLFWISRVPIVMVMLSSLSFYVVLLRGLCPSCDYELIVFCCVKMVLIDAASRELSIGCQFVNFDYLNPNGENLAAAADLAMPITF